LALAFLGDSYNALMPRTLSRSRLLIGISLFSFACAVIALLLAALRTSEQLLGLVLPTVLVWLTMVGLSERRVILFCSCLVGACVLFAFAETLLSSDSDRWTCIAPPGPWERGLSVAILASIGAFLFGATALTQEMRERLLEPRSTAAPNSTSLSDRIGPGCFL